MSDRQYLAASFRSSTLNSDARTVEVVFATETPVRRYSYREGWYEEVLEISSSAIDTTRIEEGASFLDSHRADGMANRLGGVVPGSVHIEDGKAVATIKLSRSAEGARIVSDLEDNIPLPVSVGYSIEAVERDERPEGIPLIKATRWTPLEISAVPVPADPMSHARQQIDKETAMSDNRQPVSAPAIHPSSNSREQMVRSLCQRARLPDAFAETHISAGSDESEVRDAIFEELVRQQDENPVNPSGASLLSTGPQSSIVDALCQRVMPQHFTPEPETAHLRQMGVEDIARDCLQRAGSTLTFGRAELIRNAMSTTDFPLILGDFVNRTLRAAYQTKTSALLPVTAASTARDFRPKHRLILDEKTSELTKVNENGEFEYGSVDESGESYRLATYGKIMRITRQALINDDLGAFVDLPEKYAGQVAVLVANKLADLIESPSALSDGQQVFDATLGTLIEAPLDVDGLTAARLKLRRRTGLVQSHLIDVQPAFLIVPPELETVAEKLLASLSAASVDDVNPFASRLRLIVEARLTDPEAWYVAADPADADGIEHAYLEGEGPVYIETREGFTVDAMEFKVRTDFGCGWIDRRSWVKSTGVAAE